MLTTFRWLIVVGAFMIMASHFSAELFSDAAKPGANIGAMQYCEDNLADGDDKKKYKLLKLKTLKKYDELETDEKPKALIYRKKAEDDGEYLGKKLDKDQCDSIRKMLQLKY